MGMVLVTKRVIIYTVKEENANAVFAILFIAKALYLTNKMDHFSFKSGHAMRIVKLTKIDG